MALVLALGGTSYAAIKLPANSVTIKTVKDRSLLSKDFKRGQLPAGKRGAAGPAGPQGALGPAGPAGATAGAYKAIQAGPGITPNVSQSVASSAQALTGAGAGNSAELVCTTTAASGTYDAISFTAVRVATIG